jgi:hypothetical protein
LNRRVGDGPLVVLGDAQVEVVGRLLEILLELLDVLQLGLDLRARAQRALGLDLVVPEVRGAGLLVQLRQPALEFRDVKDAPLAPADAS